MKMQNAELNLKGATVKIYGSKIARTSVKTGTGDNCSRWFYPSTGENVRASYQLFTCRVSVVIVVYFAEVTGDRYLANERYNTSCKS